MTFRVPSGTYAFAVFHDEDDDGRIAIGPDRRPREGIGFSNNAIGSHGPPTFEAASFVVDRDTLIQVTMRYWN